MLKLENIRTDSSNGDDSELRESLRLHGWHPELPAITDEFGVVLVGHRRLRLAKELNIIPVTRIVTYGSGESADGKRICLGVLSNIGGRPLSKKDRQYIAQQLYGKPEWTMEKIAEALGVSKATVSGDLQDFDCSTAKQSKHAKTSTNPRGSGRPKGKRAKGEAPPKRHVKSSEIIAIHDADKSKSDKEIAEELDVTPRVVRREREQEAIRREGQADAIIDPATLPKTWKEKYDAAIRQRERIIRQEAIAEARAESNKWMEELSLPSYAKQWAEVKFLLETKKGLMSKAEYRKVIKCLHTDTRKHVSNAEADEAFDIFKKLEVVLVAEATPTSKAFAPFIPRTQEEAEKRRREVREDRKKEREKQKTDVHPRKSKSETLEEKLREMIRNNREETNA